MPPTPPSERSALGRPAAIDAQDLARVAIGLFAERGYDAVSMADIAEAAGVGRRSLFRYYPTKADLVWAGADVVGAELERLLGEGPGDLPLGEAYADAFVGALGPRFLDVGMTRVRLRIIDAHPDLHSRSSPRITAASPALAAFVGRGLPELAGTLEAAAVAEALAAASHVALRWWATRSDDERPDASIRRAVRALALPGASR
jgi:AcrR family transcriptional regulator